MKRIFAAFLLSPLACSANWFEEKKPSYHECVLANLKSQSSEIAINSVKYHCKFEIYNNLDKLDILEGNDLKAVTAEFSVAEKNKFITNNWWFTFNNQTYKAITFVTVSFLKKDKTVQTHGFFVSIPPFTSSMVENHFPLDFFDDVERWWIASVYY